MYRGSRKHVLDWTDQPAFLAKSLASCLKFRSRWRALTKGQLRKLNALRRSVGEDIGERAFAEWLTRQATVEAVQASGRNAELIAESLWPLVEKGELAIRRGGYVLKRARGRLIVEPAAKT